MPKVGMQPIRREQILSAAFDVIAERSLESTRIRKIAKTAGVSQPSIHYYFNTKDELILALLERVLEKFREGREEVFTEVEAPFSKLQNLLKQQMHLISEKPKAHEVFFDFWVQGTKRPLVRKKFQQTYRNWRSKIREILDEGIQQGEFKPERVETGAAILVSLFHGAALQWIIDPNGFDLEKYFAQLERFIFSYLTYD